MDGMARIAVVGLGGWGKNHVRVLSELKALKALCDIDRVKVGFYEEKYDVNAYTSMDEMLCKEELDAITICTPTCLHYEMAFKAINAGLHTFVEKPLTYVSREGEELMKLAKEKKVILTAGYIERFNPAVVELKKILEEERVGKPILLEFHRENKWMGNIRDVGVIQDTSVHDIDTARWIFNSEPKVVYARTGRVISPNEDFAVIILGFEDQKTAFITSNWVTPKKVRQLIAVCTEGVVTIDFITQAVLIDDMWGTNMPRKQWQEPLLVELKAFIDCIEKGGKLLVTPQDAVNTTKIAEAALVSGQTGSPIS